MTRKKKEPELTESERLVEEVRKKLAEQPSMPPRRSSLTDEELEVVGAKKMTDIDGLIFGLGRGSTTPKK